ncbi:efflux RND transporter periplasmic adaptor subunit [Pseudomonas helleri]|uniref:Efflux RND transporter periplasmic adaptor subunit n=1 Tax=Pseudomonas helleri TaxID=1608996 RepID=A0A6A7YTP3_9PSED|nr:efflux RND transporter periplasmic adaptor subunit [Pseudomonas helleri]MQT26320.1 efflux RND transporter periplasmic adaptor subunit [Pseudomonas helleri]MQT78847.1 efflux RND transporter periplasmic adaptor subunit [Pseudomonas helleri]MQU14961.1 efflux RND transporter periplasmic adaptor subunit [Pseudomonas helleri]MQU27115.1 efflux RND transporter periplasmic adaptor subunit [Pseudomonas helleri]
MPTKTNKMLLGTLVVALIAGTLWWATRPTPVKSASAAPVPVRVVQVVSQDVPRYVTGIGAVLSLHSVMIRPQIDGILTQLLVKEGQTVKAGELLATLDDRSIKASLNQANAQLAQNQAQLKVANIDLKRYQLLSVDNGVSRQTLDQQQALVNELKATAQGFQAAIAAAQVQLSYTQIHSPVTGRVGIRSVDPGNFLRVSDTQGLFSVTQLDPIAVEFSLPQQWLPTLHTLLDAPQPALVKAFLGNAGPGGTPLGQGRLSLIDNQVSATTGTIKVKAQFDNPSHTLWPGQLVNIEIQTGLEKNALVVPPQVVQRGLDNYFVYRTVGDKVETVPVQVVYQDTARSVISGVKVGDTLVSDGQSRLKPGSHITVLSEPALTEPPRNPPVQP